MLMLLLFTKEIAIYDTILSLSRDIPCISGTVRTEQNHSVSQTGKRRRSLVHVFYLEKYNGPPWTYSTIDYKLEEKSLE